MTEPPVDISVIICAYTEDRWHDLVAAVTSVHSQTLTPREIIVVIDHNPALLARVTSEIAGVVVIANRYAKGLSGARNSGIQAATGEILAFLDEDAFAAEDWLAQLHSGYASATTLGVGGSIIPLWLSRSPRWFPEEFLWVVGCTYRGMPDVTAPVRNLIGCNMSFRRIVFDKLGGFRQGIGRIGTQPFGCEETEFCIRLLQQMPDAHLLYEPKAHVHHRVPAIRARWHYFRSRCYAEGISKAQIARLVGSRDSLSNEWSYTLRTLPLGMMQGLREAVLHFKPAGIARAGAIAVGLLVTLLGYLHGVQFQRGQNAEAATAYESNLSA